MNFPPGEPPGAPNELPPHDSHEEQIPSPPPYRTPTAEHPDAVPRKTNGWAIASLVSGVIGAVLVSVISGIVALVQTKRGRQRGRGIAIAGLVLSALWTAGFVALSVVLLSGSSGTIAGNQLKVGDCFERAPYVELPVKRKIVACSQPHEAEVTAIYTLPDGPYPGEEAVQGKRELCHGPNSQHWAPHWPPSVDVGDIRAGSLYPSKQSWNDGDRTIVCTAFLATPR